MSSKPLIQKQEGFTKSGIHYTVTRSDASTDALILIYGYGGNVGMWPVRFIDRLAERFMMVCLDNRGVGQSVSPKVPTEYSVEVMAGDVDAVAQALGLSQFHLLGYSLGGCIALGYTNLHPEKVKSLFLMSTTGGGALWSKPKEDLGTTLATPVGQTLWDMYVSVWKTTMSDATMERYDSSLREMFENSSEYVTPQEALTGHLHAFRNFDSSVFVNQIKIPVTIFAGADDRLIPVQNSINLANKIPQAKLVQVPGCEHYPQVEAQDELVAEIIALCNLAK